MNESCPYCFIGRLHPRRQTLTRLIGGTLVHLPNVSVGRCDICGQVVYDEALLRRFDVLLGDSRLPPNYHTASADSAGTESVGVSVSDDAGSVRDQPE